MMGQEICDPDHVEGSIERLPGLGLLPVLTKMLAEKTTRQVKFKFLDEIDECNGYEIHMGITTPMLDAEITHLNSLKDGSQDGYWISNRCFGSYIHGILDNEVVIDYLLKPYTAKLNEQPFDYVTFKEQQYDKLADHIRQYVNIELIYQIMQAS